VCLLYSSDLFRFRRRRVASYSVLAQTLDHTCYSRDLVARARTLVAALPAHRQSSTPPRWQQHKLRLYRHHSKQHILKQMKPFFSLIFFVYAICLYSGRVYNQEMAEDIFLQGAKAFFYLT